MKAALTRARPAGRAGQISSTTLDDNENDNQFAFGWSSQPGQKLAPGSRDCRGSPARLL
jgi:hypothetical protein